MIRTTGVLLAWTGFIWAGSALAVCPLPDPVQVPAGGSASKDEMLEGRQLVEQYMADMEDYLDCLDKEEADLGEAVTDEQRQLHVKRHNAAVDQMQAVAADFNEQVRAYKAANE